MRAFLEVITKRAAHVNSNTLSTEVIRTPALRPLPKMLDKNPTANSLNPISFMVMGIIREKIITAVNKAHELNGISK